MSGGYGYGWDSEGWGFAFPPFVPMDSPSSSELPAKTGELWRGHPAIHVASVLLPNANPNHNQYRLGSTNPSARRRQLLTDHHPDAPYG